MIDLELAERLDTELLARHRARRELAFLERIVQHNAACILLLAVGDAGHAPAAGIDAAGQCRALSVR